MNKSILAASLISLLAATLPVQGQSGPEKSLPATRAQMESLLTPEERGQFRDKMRAATTREERSEIQKQMRATREQRAKEKGIVPPRGPEGGRNAGQEGSRPQLLTQDERLHYREKMRAAKSPEERAVLRKQMRELTEQRAKEKGVTLPQRRAPGDTPKAGASKSP